MQYYASNWIPFTCPHNRYNGQTKSTLRFLRLRSIAPLHEELDLQYHLIVHDLHIFVGTDPRDRDLRVAYHQTVPNATNISREVRAMLTPTALKLCSSRQRRTFGHQAPAPELHHVVACVGDVVATFFFQQWP